MKVSSARGLLRAAIGGGCLCACACGRLTRVCTVKSHGARRQAMRGARGFENFPTAPAQALLIQHCTQILLHHVGRLRTAARSVRWPLLLPQVHWHCAAAATNVKRGGKRHHSRRSTRLLVMVMMRLMVMCISLLIHRRLVLLLLHLLLL